MVFTDNILESGRRSSSLTMPGTFDFAVGAGDHCHSGACRGSCERAPRAGGSGNSTASRDRDTAPGPGDLRRPRSPRLGLCCGSAVDDADPHGDAARLTQGRSALADSEPEFALVPARLTVTFGTGRASSPARPARLQLGCAPYRHSPSTGSRRPGTEATFCFRSRRGGRESSLGRTLAVGAPPTGVKETDELDFDATTRLGFPVVPEYSHIRCARSDNPNERIFRRGYNFDEAPAGPTISNSGLLFACFQADVDAQFVPIQECLDELDLLNQWTTPISSAVFAIHPAAAPTATSATRCFHGATHQWSSLSRPSPDAPRTHSHLELGSRDLDRLDHRLLASRFRPPE